MDACEVHALESSSSSEQWDGWPIVLLCPVSFKFPLTVSSNIADNEYSRHVAVHCNHVLVGL